MKNLDQVSDRLFPNIKCVLTSRACTNILTVTWETALFPRSPTKSNFSILAAIHLKREVLINEVLQLLYGLGFPIFAASQHLLAVINSYDAIRGIYQKAAVTRGEHNRKIWKQKTHSPRLANSMLFTAVAFEDPNVMRKLALTLSVAESKTSTFPFELPVKTCSPRLSNEATIFKSA